MIVAYGVFTTKDFCNKNFSLQYPGVLLFNSEGRRLEKSCPTDLGLSIFFFSFMEINRVYIIYYFLLGLSLLLVDISQNLFLFVISLASKETQSLYNVFYFFFSCFFFSFFFVLFLQLANCKIKIHCWQLVRGLSSRFAQLS